MSAARKSRYVALEARFRRQERHPLLAVAVHWAAQSLLYMDSTERRFKLTLDAVLTASGGMLLSSWLPWQMAWPVAFLIAHTLNFLFNGQLWCALKDYGLVSHTYAAFKDYTLNFGQRARREPALTYVAIYGSLSRQAWSAASDLDVRLVRQPGFVNGWRACCFVLRERTRALFHRFPLDIYVLDDPDLLRRMRQDESPVVLHQTSPVSKRDRPATSSHAVADTAVASITFLRGANIDSGVGQTDFRIAYHFPDLGFHTTLIMFGRHAASTVERGAEVRVVAAPSIPVIQGVWLNVAALRQLWKQRCDVLVCNSGMHWCGAVYKHLRPKVNLILDVRSVPVEVNGLSGWVKEKLFALAVRSHSLDGLSVITGGILKEVQDRFRGRRDLPTVIWSSGVDGDLFDATTSGQAIRDQYDLHGAFVLMYHGSLSPTRGLELILQAMAILVTLGHKHVRVMFLGKGAHRARLMALADELGLNDCVLFLAPVPHETVPQFVAAADVGLDPLPDHPWWNYSSPIKVYEYLHMGKPVLASDIPAHRDISEAVFLVPERDPIALADAIKRLMELDSKEREQLRELALEAGARSTWRVRAETLSYFLRTYFLVGPDK